MFLFSFFRCTLYIFLYIYCAFYVDINAVYKSRRMTTNNLNARTRICCLACFFCDLFHQISLLTFAIEVPVRFSII